VQEKVCVCVCVCVWERWCVDMWQPAAVNRRHTHTRQPKSKPEPARWGLLRK